MSSSLYISTTEPGTGKALVSIGIIESILRRTTKVGFFRPIICEPKEQARDEDIDLILRHFNLAQSYESSYGLFSHTADELI